MANLPAHRGAHVLRDGRIDCEIDHPVHGWIPFTADPSDPEEHGRLIHAELTAKPDAEKTFQGPESAAELAAKARAVRDERLAKEVDPYAGHVLVWEGLTVAQQDEMRAHRQALLDVPQQSSFPDPIAWPTKPAFVK